MMIVEGNKLYMNTSNSRCQLVVDVVKNAELVAGFNLFFNTGTDFTYEETNLKNRAPTLKRARHATLLLRFSSSYLIKNELVFRCDDPTIKCLVIFIILRFPLSFSPP